MFPYLAPLHCKMEGGGSFFDLRLMINDLGFLMELGCLVITHLK